MIPGLRHWTEKKEMLSSMRGVLFLKRVAQEKAQAARATVISDFKSMLREKGDITSNTRWSKVKDNLRNDPRYKAVKHEDREVLFDEYLSELKAAEEKTARVAKAKYDEEVRLERYESFSSLSSRFFVFFLWLVNMVMMILLTRSHDYTCFSRAWLAYNVILN
nr:pre-mRNA-processing protein 40C isoform X1 [Ipomoea batatas]